MVLESRTQKGRHGECLASVFLEDRGHRILERNWRWGKAEVDLISTDGCQVVFHEVKLRTGCDQFHNPEAWHPRAGQRRRIARAAHQYMRLRKWEGLGWRFDVLLVCLTQSDEGWAHRIRWHPEAFFPEPT